jgi:UDP-N-acetylmuramoyl-tripeptide--D-alanyl-D-alanine ligase
LATPLPENRARFALGEIADAAGGRVLDADPARELRGISTDSRTVPAGALFVALVGETHDGHRFVPAAVERGAVPLVAAGRGLAGPRVEVDDTLAALGRLARAFVDRERAAAGPPPVLAIGGAAGKTTTKTLAAAAVGALFGPTLVTAGNLNNRIGVPMTLLTLDAGHRAMVLELGTSVPGEIAELGRIARPDVGMVLNVDVEHSEKLGDLEAIANEEAELLFAARKVALASSDEPLLVVRLAHARAAQRTFGTAPSADVRVLDRGITSEGVSVLSLRIAGTLAEVPEGLDLEARTRLLGPTAAANVAAALAGALALLGRPASADEVETATRAVAGVRAVPGRLRPLPARDGILVLDDTYNSNPRSVAAALETAREVAQARGGRWIAVLGDMLELGDLAPDAHDGVLRVSAESGAARLILVGPEMAAAADRIAPTLPLSRFSDSTAAAAAIDDLVAAGDLVLIKGSRGIRTERIAEALGAAVTPEAL